MFNKKKKLFFMRHFVQVLITKIVFNFKKSLDFKSTDIHTLHSISCGI